MSQEQLARLVGVTVGAISQYERGVHTPRHRTAQLIDAALEADGQLMAAFGHTRPDDSRLTLLEERVEALQSVVEELAEWVQQHDESC